MNERLMELRKILVEGEMKPSFLPDVEEEADFWVPLEDKNRLSLFGSPNGGLLIPALPDGEGDLGPFRRARLARIPYGLLKRLVADDPEALAGIAIDPFGRNLIANSQLIRAMDSGVPGMAGDGAGRYGKVTFQIPDNLPPEIERELEEFFSLDSQIGTSWVVDFQEDGRDGHRVSIIQFQAMRRTICRREWRRCGDRREEGH